MNIKKVSGDVKYEIDMLRHTSDLLSKPNFSQVIHNALLESFTVHARNLFIFFYTKDNNRKFRDDILAEDYLTTKKDFIKNRTKKADLKSLTKRVDKMVVHLTYHRAVYNKKTKMWMVTNIRKKMDKTIDAFKNALPVDRKNWFS